jgi:hypothetical protein
MAVKEFKNKLEIWEESLASLDESLFLILAANFIGKVPTPFHRPQIIKRLTTLFSNDLFVKRVEDSLTLVDRQILTVTALLGSATQKQLCELFANGLSYAVIQQEIVNLEERLLLIPSNKSQMLMVNPLLYDNLIENYLSLETLFKGGPKWKFIEIDRRLLKGIFNLHLHSLLGSLDRSEKLLSGNLGKDIFSVDTKLLLAYNRLLFKEKVVFTIGKKNSISFKNFDDLLSLNDQQLNYLLFTASCNHDESHLLKKFYETTILLLNKIDVSSDADLLLVIKIAAIRSSIVFEDYEALLMLFKEIVLNKKGHSVDQQEAKVTIDSDLILSFNSDVPKIEGNDYLHLLAQVKKIDLISSYEINKRSLFKAFDYFLTVEEIITYLEKLTKTVPTSLRQLLEQWYTEFTSITIYDGLVVKTNERVGRIINSLPNLQEHILATIDKNIFLFSRKTEQIWREILLSTGFDSLPSTIGEHDFGERTLNKEVLKFTKDITLLELVDYLTKNSEKEIVTGKLGFQEELKELIKKKSHFKEHQEEMLARLERRLILIDEQVTQSDGKTQIMEASGFDYQGKLNLCKAAVNSPMYLLELHLLDDDGVAQVVLSEVKEFIKGTKESSVRISVLPDEKEMVVGIGKVFKVRKLRRSIFF